MENQRKQQLGIVHWIGILVFGGIALLIIFGDSKSDIRARLEAEEKASSSVVKSDSSAALAARSEEAELIALLDENGKIISSNSENNAIKYVKSFKVPESDIPAYKSIFTTSHKGLMSLPDADKDRVAYAQNVARTEVWQAVFCKPEIRDALRKYNLSVISANLEDEAGEMQSMAVCVLRN